MSYRPVRCNIVQLFLTHLLGCPCHVMLQFCFRSALTASLAIGRLECFGSTVNFCALASARRSLHYLQLQIQVQHVHVSPAVGLRYAIANKAAVSTEDSTFQNAAMQITRTWILVKSAKFAGWYGGHCHRPSLYHCYSFSLFCFACFSVFSLPVAGDDIPEEFLENAKRIGKEALKAKEIASSR